mgnify:CR=1 FL=1
MTERQEEDKQFIALHLYDMKSETDTGVVYYANENVYQVGTYINNPHFLSRVDVPPGVSRFKVVVSQYEKIADLTFTLNVYCTAKCVISPLPRPCTHVTKVQGAWSTADGTAGGSPNHPQTFLRNPQFVVKVTSASQLLLKLEGPRDVSLNVMAFHVRPDAGVDPKRLSTCRVSSMFDRCNGISNIQVCRRLLYRINVSVYYCLYSDRWLMPVRIGRVSVWLTSCPRILHA